MSFSVTASQGLTIGSVTIPVYSKGFIVATGQSGNDATLYAVDPDGNFYSAYRNGTTWGSAQKVRRNTTYTSPCNYTYNKRTIKYTISGSLVYCFVEGLVGVPAGSTTISTIPSDCRPSVNIQQDCFFLLNNTSGIKLRINAMPSGELQVYNYGSSAITNNNENITFIYPLERSN